MRILMVCLVLALGACSDEAEQKEISAKGREETRNIRATEHVGYSGNAIADKVDGALNTQDQRAQRLDEAAAEAAK